MRRQYNSLLDHAKRNKKLVSVFSVALAIFAVFAYYYILPERSTYVNQDVPQGMEDAVGVRSGTFVDGDSFHMTSGKVTLFREGDKYFLRFENYEATPGPDVYFYLTKGGATRDTDSVEKDGLKLLVEGGQDGHATLRGNFNVKLPDGFNPQDYDTLIVWCDTYNVLFGSAQF